MASVDGQEYDTLQGTVVITDSVGTGTVVEVTKAAEGSVVNAPAGVQVMNEFGVPIKVNAEEEPEIQQIWDSTSHSCWQEQVLLLWLFLEKECTKQYERVLDGSR